MHVGIHMNYDASSFALHIYVHMYMYDSSHALKGGETILFTHTHRVSQQNPIEPIDPVLTLRIAFLVTFSVPMSSLSLPMFPSFLSLPLSPSVSHNLPLSPHVSLSLPVFPLVFHISLPMSLLSPPSPTSPLVSPSLPQSPHVYPCLPDICLSPFPISLGLSMSLSVSQETSGDWLWFQWDSADSVYLVTLTWDNNPWKLWLSFWSRDKLTIHLQMLGGKQGHSCGGSLATANMLPTSYVFLMLCQQVHAYIATFLWNIVQVLTRGMNFGQCVKTKKNR